MTIAGLGFNVSQNAPPFTDDPLISQVTPIRAVHITELRTRIDALRQQFELSPFAWTDPTLAVVFVKAVHITELRVALNDAYSAAAQSPPSYTDPTLGPGVTMKVAHVAELRAAIVAVE
jgi:hypothetical protein